VPIQVKKHLVQNYHTMKANTARERECSEGSVLSLLRHKMEVMVSFFMLRLLCFQEEYRRF